MMSDESDLEIEDTEHNIYRRKYQLLYERCDSILIHNENLLKRIYKISQLYKRRKAECQFLMNRLTNHGDDWQNAPPLEIKPTIDVQTKIEKREPTKKRLPKKKQRADRAERDPNAPKRPPNAFFQFCQDQRQNVLEEFKLSLQPGEPELSKQDLTRKLANKWKSMSSDDKRVYVDMYERSKEKYNLELNAYNKS